jgi:hypothetical protein
MDSGPGFEPHIVTAKPDILLIRSGKVTFGQADVVYSIQDIGLAHAVIAYEAIHFFRKSKVFLFVIFEVGQVDGPEEQGKLELTTKLAKVSSKWYLVVGRGFRCGVNSILRCYVPRFLPHPS